MKKSRVFCLALYLTCLLGSVSASAWDVVHCPRLSGVYKCIDQGRAFKLVIEEWGGATGKARFAKYQFTYSEFKNLVSPFEIKNNGKKKKLEGTEEERQNAEKFWQDFQSPPVVQDYTAAEGTDPSLRPSCIGSEDLKTDLMAVTQKYLGEKAQSYLDTLDKTLVLPLESPNPNETQGTAYINRANGTGELRVFIRYQNRIESVAYYECSPN